MNYKMSRFIYLELAMKIANDSDMVLKVQLIYKPIQLN